MTMRRTPALALTLGLLAGCQQMSSTTPQETAQPATVERTQMVTATVEAVDQAERLVTLRGPDGDPFTVHVADEVRNLPQVEVGDQVVIRYREAIAAELSLPGARRGGRGQRPGHPRAARGAAGSGAGAAGQDHGPDRCAGPCQQHGLVHRPERPPADGRRAGPEDAGLPADADGRRSGRDHLQRGARYERRAGQLTGDGGRPAPLRRAAPHGMPPGRNGGRSR
jgi:hypothetical protein